MSNLEANREPLRFEEQTPRWLEWLYNGRSEHQWAVMTSHHHFLHDVVAATRSRKEGARNDDEHAKVKAMTREALYNLGQEFQKEDSKETSSQPKKNRCVLLYESNSSFIKEVRREVGHLSDIVAIGTYKSDCMTIGDPNWHIHSIARQIKDRNMDATQISVSPQLTVHREGGTSQGHVYGVRWARANTTESALYDAPLRYGQRRTAEGATSGKWLIITTHTYFAASVMKEEIGKRGFSFSKEFWSANERLTQIWVQLKENDPTQLNDWVKVTEGWKNTIVNQGGIFFVATRDFSCLSSVIVQTDLLTLVAYIEERLLRHYGIYVLSAGRSGYCTFVVQASPMEWESHFSDLERFSRNEGKPMNVNPKRVIGTLKSKELGNVQLWIQRPQILRHVPVAIIPVGAGLKIEHLMDDFLSMGQENGEEVARMGDLYVRHNGACEKRTVIGIPTAKIAALNSYFDETREDFYLIWADMATHYPPWNLFPSLRRSQTTEEMWANTTEKFIKESRIRCDPVALPLLEGDDSAAKQIRQGKRIIWRSEQRTALNGKLIRLDINKPFRTSVTNEAEQIILLPTCPEQAKIKTMATCIAELVEKHLGIDNGYIQAEPGLGGFGVDPKKLDLLYARQKCEVKILTNSKGMATKEKLMGSLRVLLYEGNTLLVRSGTWQSEGVKILFQVGLETQEDEKIDDLEKAQTELSSHGNLPHWARTLQENARDPSETEVEPPKKKGLPDMATTSGTKKVEQNGTNSAKCETAEIRQCSEVDSNPLPETPTPGGPPPQGPTYVQKPTSQVPFAIPTSPPHPANAQSIMEKTPSQGNLEEDSLNAEQGDEDMIEGVCVVEESEEELDSGSNRAHSSSQMKSAALSQNKKDKVSNRFCYIATAFKLISFLELGHHPNTHVHHLLLRAFARNYTQDDPRLQPLLNEFLRTERPIQFASEKDAEDDALGLVLGILGQLIDHSILQKAMPILSVKLNCSTCQGIVEGNRHPKFDSSGRVPVLKETDLDHRPNRQNRDKCFLCGTKEIEEQIYLTGEASKFILALASPIEGSMIGQSIPMHYNGEEEEAEVIAQLLHRPGAGAHYVVEIAEIKASSYYDPCSGKKDWINARSEYRVVAIVLNLKSSSNPLGVEWRLLENWKFFEKEIAKYGGGLRKRPREEKTIASTRARRRRDAATQAKEIVGRTTEPSTSQQNPDHQSEICGAICLFDGTSTAIVNLERIIGYRPQVVISAEIIPIVRVIISDIHEYDVNGSKWCTDKQGSTTFYTKNVWSLLEADALMLRQMVGMLKRLQRKGKGEQASKPPRIFLVGGSPCQNLTEFSDEAGALGVVGPQSVHFHVFIAIINSILAIDKQTLIFPIVENAGSMLKGIRPRFLRECDTPVPNHQMYMAKILGYGEAKACQQVLKYMSAKKRGAAVQRNRNFITPSNGIPQGIDAVTQPWEPGWGTIGEESKELVEVGSLKSPPVDRVLPPWLRTRGTAPGNCEIVVQTFSAYSPENLLYKYEELGSKETFQTKTVVEKDWKKWLDWSSYINQETIDAMDHLRTLLRKGGKSGRLYPTKEDRSMMDSYAIMIAIGLHKVVAPFRTPTLEEKLKECELEAHFSGLTYAKGLADANAAGNMAGNFFKPSIFRAAIVGESKLDVQNFLNCNVEGLALPQGTPFEKVDREFEGIKSVVKAYVAKHFPGSYYKIKETWHPLPHPLNQEWLNHISELPTIPPSYAIRPPINKEQDVTLAMMGGDIRSLPTDEIEIPDILLQAFNKVGDKNALMKKLKKSLVGDFEDLNHLVLALQLFKQIKQDVTCNSVGELKDLLGFTVINQDWLTTLARMLQRETSIKQEIWVLGSQDLGVGIGMTLRSSGHADGILEVIVPGLIEGRLHYQLFCMPKHMWTCTQWERISIKRKHMVSVSWEGKPREGYSKAVTFAKSPEECTFTEGGMLASAPVHWAHWLRFVIAWQIGGRRLPMLGKVGEDKAFPSDDQVRDLLRVIFGKYNNHEEVGISCKLYIRSPDAVRGMLTSQKDLMARSLYDQVHPTNGLPAAGLVEVEICKDLVTPSRIANVGRYIQVRYGSGKHIADPG